jgi:TIR domain/Pentapeptide repeats (8 copies)
MNRDEALKLLKGGREGIREWNRRRAARESVPDLSKVDLGGADLYGADLSGGKLYGANLNEADLRRADLRAAHLNEANLSCADLSAANLHSANLSAANLRAANLYGADLSAANLGEACLVATDFHATAVAESDFSRAFCYATKFSNVDLSGVKGLDSVVHRAPSSVGTGTLFRSKGQIPESFLRGCGLPDNLISYLPSLIGSLSPIQFYSSFISYTTKDEDFAKRLHSKMCDAGLRVWFAPEDIHGGKKLHEQLDEAIRLYDKLLLVLSRESMNSEWVKTEIRNARSAEVKDGKRRLFPIRLVSFDAIREWKCFDGDAGKDLGAEIREYFIPDFSNWKDRDSFEAAFARLLKDLQSAQSDGAKPE